MNILRKPLGDFARHLKQMTQEISEDYAISHIYKSIAAEEIMRNGISAFRDFLGQFFDYIIENAELHDKPKPNANRTWGGVNFTMDYPFLRDMATVLMNVGIYGELNASGDALALSGGELLSVLKKARVQKAAEYLRYLTECGIEFFGIDLDIEKPDLSKALILEVSYPDAPVMLIGLKTMAYAQLEINKKRFKPGTWACVNTIDNVFLRCDCKALSGEEVEQLFLIKEITKPFPVETQELVLKLHQRFLDSGFKCEITTGRNSAIGFYLLYAYKVKPIRVVNASWIIGITPNNCGVKIDARNAEKYSELVDKFPLDFLELIKTGNGCVYDPAPKKCRLQNTGYKFIINGAEYVKCSAITCSDNVFWVPMTNLTNEKGCLIESWIDKELSYIT